MNYWVDYEYRKQRPKNLSVDEVINSFCSFIHHYNTSADTYADTDVKGLFDEGRFREYFSKCIGCNALDDRHIISCYFEAIYYSLTGMKLDDNIRVVEKSVENAEFAELLSRFFPDAKFLHIVRNPYANLVSLRKSKSIGVGYPLMSRVIRTLYNSFYFLYRNRKSIPNYFVIRYEDLVTEPELWMRRVADFLNIKFDPILLQPTVMGRSWSGNSSFGQSFSGISTDSINRWKKEIHPMEVYYVTKVFHFVLRDFNYPIYNAPGSFWKPARGENIIRYLYNRIYRFYIPI
jgi:hypothetical protein